jgi:small conductance mechanosensitive channel
MFAELIEKLQQWWNNTGWLEHLLPTLLLLAAGAIVIRIIVSIVNRMLKKSKLEKAAHGLIRSVVRVVLYILLGLACASALGIDVTGVVALASVVTLALSLALQDSLTNLIGGFTLLYTHPFASGHYVEIAGQSGTVLEIGMAYTKLATPDNKIISIPNSSVVAAEIVNYTVTGTRRLAIDIYTDFDAPIEKVLSALREAADIPEKLEENGIFAEVMDYSEKGIHYSVRIWTTGDDYWNALFIINRRINTIFTREGLRMAYPQLQVHSDKK